MLIVFFDTKSQIDQGSHLEYDNKSMFEIQMYV